MRWLLVLAAPVFALPANAAPMFVPLGDLPGGSFYSSGRDVSDDGGTAVGVTISASGPVAEEGAEGFRWSTASGMVGMGDLGGTGASEAWAVSADGTVVVGETTSPAGREAFRWSLATGMQSIGDLAGGAVFGQAYGISGDGMVIVGSGVSAAGLEAFRWTETGGMDSLAPGQAFDASLDGSVVVGRSGGSAFRWTSSGGVVSIGGDVAHGVSDDGSVVVGANGNEAFRWSLDSGLAGLGDLPGGGFFSEAWGVSADGMVVVGESGGVGGLDAFIWDESNGMRSIQAILEGELGLDLGGWRLSRADGISADGLTIVGQGTNPAGHVEAWMAVIPEPGTGLLVTAGVLGLAASRRRRAS